MVMISLILGADDTKICAISVIRLNLCSARVSAIKNALITLRLAIPFYHRTYAILSGSKKQEGRRDKEEGIHS